MEIDFSELRKEVATMDKAFFLAAEGNNMAFIYKEVNAPRLSDKIGIVLKPLMQYVTPQSSPELLEEMDFLYSKMISFRPFESYKQVVKGIFHTACGQFDKAVGCFQNAYDIQRDPTRKTWPHLQASESNARLMVEFGYALYHSGAVEEGKRFFNAGHKMVDKLKPVDAVVTPLPPAEPR